MNLGSGNFAVFHQGCGNLAPRNLGSGNFDLCLLGFGQDAPNILGFDNLALWFQGLGNTVSNIFGLATCQLLHTCLYIGDDGKNNFLCHNLGHLNGHWLGGPQYVEQKHLSGGFEGLLGLEWAD
jgi:hypothetical protein